MDDDTRRRLSVALCLFMIVCLLQQRLLLFKLTLLHEQEFIGNLATVCFLDLRFGSLPGESLFSFHFREAQQGETHQIERWKRLFRVSTLVYNTLYRDLHDILHLSPHAHGHSASVIKPHETIAIGLRIMGSPAYLHNAATEMGRSPQSMKKHTMRFVRAVIRRYGNRLFYFPETVGQVRSACNLMLNLREIPNCVGALDGKVVFMNWGAHDNVAFKSYKGGGSRGINVLVLASADYRVRWHSAFAGGNEVDASLWNNTRLKRRIARLEWPPADSRQAINQPPEECPHLRPVLLVDATFAASEVQLKPYPAAQLNAPSKLFFNKVHDSGRKGGSQIRHFAQPVRWIADSTAEDLCDLIKCAFILHNLCINMNDRMDEDEGDDEGDDNQNQDWAWDEQLESARGVMSEYREYFSDRFELTEDRLTFRRIRH
eukprot:g54338.t1